jgi:hypothetical protein
VIELDLMERVDSSTLRLISSIVLFETAQIAVARPTSDVPNRTVDP